MDKKEYLSQMYEYLVKEGYTIIKEYIPNLGYSLQVVSLQDDKYFNNRGDLKNHNYTKFYSKNDFVDYVIKEKKYISFNSNEFIRGQFFINIFNGSSKDEQLFMIKNIKDYVGDLWRSKFSNIFGQILNTTKDLDYLHSIPISTWEANTVPLKDLDKLVIEKGLKDKAYDNFYLKFFKSRKNQIKNANCGPAVKDFLLTIYGRDEEKLKPYCVFFNYIKELFEEIDLDIVEPTPEFTVLSRFNCRKASKLLCMPNYGEKEINKLITNFVYLMQPYKGIQQAYVEDFGTGVIEVRCDTDKSFTQEELNKEIKDYLLFKKKNIHILLDSQSIEKYFLSKDLTSELVENKVFTKKIKL